MTTRPTRSMLHIPGEGKRQMPNVFSRTNLAKLDEAQSSRPVTGEQYREVFLAALKRDSPLQTRAQFDPVGDEEDQALVTSLAQHGQRIPVQLAEVEGVSPPEYAILDGHRRVAALRHLKQAGIKAIIVRQGTLECDLISLTANIRKNLSPLELARAIDRLRRQHHLTIDAIAKDAGLSRQYISALAGLLEADPAIPAAVEAGHISATTARLLSHAPRAVQPQLAQTAAACELSDAQAKRLVQRVGATGETPAQAALALGLSPTPAPSDLEQAESLPSSTPHQDHAAEPGKRQTLLTVEGAMALLNDILPDLNPDVCAVLSAQAAQVSADPPLLKIAGLLICSGTAPSEAMKTARTLGRAPGLRRLVAILDICVELRLLMKAGRFHPRVVPILKTLGDELRGLEQQGSQLNRA